MATETVKLVDKARDSMELTVRTRHCTSCGRQIEWNQKACPYCGHDFHKDSPLEETLDGGLRALYYLLSAFFPIVGFFLGTHLMSKPSPHVYRVGKICVLLAFAPTLLLFGLAFVVVHVF